jgi:hypothetical protein
MDYTAIATQIFNYETYIVVPVGTVLNILTIIVFSTSKFKQTNFGFITNFVVLAETLSLTYTCIVYKYILYKGVVLYEYSKVMCFFYRYLGRYLQLVPSYMEVFLSVYQYLEITFISGHILKSRCNIVFTIVCLLTIVALIHAPNLYTSMLIQPTAVPNATTKATIICTQSDDLSYLAGIEVCLMRAVPLPIIVIFSYLIVRTLFKSRNSFNSSKQPQQTAAKRNENRSSVSRENSFAFVLFFANLIYFLMNFPIAVTYLMETFFIYSTNGQIVGLMHNIMNAVSLFYCALPFFVNFAFNRAFRSQIYRFLSKLTTLFKSNSNNNNASSTARSTS